MAVGDIEDEVAGSPAPPAGNDLPAPAGGGAPVGGGGGPNLAAMGRASQGPQISAPGAGNTANSMSKLLQAITQIQEAIQGLQPGTPLHRDALQAVTRLSRHLPAGAPTAGVQLTSARDLIRQIMQSPFMGQVMRQIGGAGGAGGAGGGGGQQGAPAGPAPQQAPMPSMPLPGA